jgi:competence protein ComEA
MSARSVLLAAAAPWVVALAATSASAPAQVRGDLPPGQGRETVVTICGDCHGAELIAAQRRSRVEWETLVEDMAARNGVASEDEKKVIVAYAVKNFAKVNINIATADEIGAVVELPAAQAAAIVEYRQKSGEFKTLDDLRKVPGVDFAKIQERKDRIGFTGP